MSAIKCDKRACSQYQAVEHLGQWWINRRDGDMRLIAHCSRESDANMIADALNSKKGEVKQ